MAKYSLATFIQAYQPTDKYLTLLDDHATKTSIISVCHYEGAQVNGKYLSIKIEDRSTIKLEFQNKSIAVQAANALQTAMEELEPNCDLVPTTGETPFAESITLTQYKSLQSGNQLVEFQWYDIADIDDIFNVGGTLRVQALSTDDYQPRGIIPTTNIEIKINVIDDTIQYWEDSENKLLATNKSLINNLGTSTQITADNDSNVSTDNSNNIYAHKSTLVITDCEDIFAHNCNLTLVGAERCKFFNINQDLSSLANLLSDITVDQTSSLGKVGVETFDYDTVGNRTYKAYVLKNTYKFDLNLATRDYLVTLDNPIPDANAEVWFEIINTGVTVNTHSIDVRRPSFVSIFQITAGDIGSRIGFRWNKESNRFELIPANKAKEERIYNIPIEEDGEIDFIIPYPVTSAETAKLFVNGALQEFGEDKDYIHVAGNQIQWLNRHFELKTVHTVIYYYY